MTTTDDDRMRLAKALEAGQVQGARERNPDAAQALFRRVIHALRNDRPLWEATRKFLADALENACKDPKHAGAALGLVGKQTRPKSKLKPKRDLQIAIAVLRHSRAGLPIADNKNRDGAISKVAKEMGFGRKTVVRAWDDFTKIQSLLSDINSPD